MTSSGSVVVHLLVAEPDEVRRVVAVVVADEHLVDRRGTKSAGMRSSTLRQRRRRVVRDDEDPDSFHRRRG